MIIELTRDQARQVRPLLDLCQLGFQPPRFVVAEVKRGEDDKIVVVYTAVTQASARQIGAVIEADRK